MPNFNLNEENKTTSSKATRICLVRENYSGATIQIPAEVFVTLLSSLQRVPRLRTLDTDLMVIKQRFDTTFHQFVKLAPEIRGMIWAAAANSPETIRIHAVRKCRIREPGAAEYGLAPLAIINPRYNLLRACRDAHDAVTKIQSPVFRRSKQRSSESDIENHWLVMNSDVDILWLAGVRTGCTVAFQYVPWIKKKEALERTNPVIGICQGGSGMGTSRPKIKTIVTNMGCWEEAHDTGKFPEWMSSMCFLGAEDLIFTVGNHVLDRRPESTLISPRKNPSAYLKWVIVTSYVNLEYPKYWSCSSDYSLKHRLEDDDDWAELEAMIAQSIRQYTANSLLSKNIYDPGGHLAYAFNSRSFKHMQSAWGANDWVVPRIRFMEVVPRGTLINWSEEGNLGQQLVGLARRSL